MNVSQSTVGPPCCAVSRNEGDRLGYADGLAVGEDDDAELFAGAAS